MELEDKTVSYDPASRVSLRARKIEKQPVYKADKVELSKNIRNFDSLPKVKVEEKTRVLSANIGMTLTATQMVSDSTYNKVGKMLGVDTVADWNKNYDKIYNIVQKAKESLNGGDIDEILKWIYKHVNAAPSITNRRLDDLNTYLALK